MPTITGEIKRQLRDGAWAVRVPARPAGARAARRARQRRADPRPRPGAVRRGVARAIDVEAEDLLEARQAATAYGPTSLDMPRAGGDEELGASLGDTVGLTEGGYHGAEQRAALGKLMRVLTDREREVIRLRSRTT